ncbi:MAG: phosphodiester glycosidase family protein, partial [Bacteroidales bacterium]|nr:phosphodiester glycosidase family protein [Bacteroidales bacterium]
FLFGDDILATAVCHPVNPDDGMARRDVWFPPESDWFDMATGTMYKGGTVRTLSYTLAENPWYVRSGALIPMASPSIQSLQEKSDELYILAVPGENDFKTSLYEDCGENADYDTACSFTEIVRTMTDSGIRVTVGARDGHFPGALEKRRIRLVLQGFQAPSKVIVNGKELPYGRFASDGTWGYDGASLCAVIYLSPTSVAEQTVIECNGSFAFTSGESGCLKRARAAAEAVKNAQNAEDKRKWPDDNKMQWICAASQITENPFSASDILASLPEFPFNQVENNPIQADTLGRGLRLLEMDGLHILEIAPEGDYAVGFGYSDEAKSVTDFGIQEGLEAVSTATFGLPHTFVRVGGKTISDISIGPDNSRWWMHEAAVMMDRDGALSFANFDNMPQRAVDSYRSSNPENLFSSAPMLIYDGLPLKWRIATKVKDGFINKSYPRTVLAQLWDGTVLIITSDKPLSLPELQCLLSDNFFVRNAINLDGSAALYVKGRGNICSKATERQLNTFITVRRK